MTPPSSDSTNSREERSLFSNFRIVSLMTLLSRILGLFRDMGMAVLFGNGPVMDAFSIAFRIPNLARRLFGEGALSTAFLPAFIQQREDFGLTKAWQLVTAILIWLTKFLGSIVLILILIIWALGSTLFTNEEYQLLLGLTACMLPYLLLICLVAQMSAVMHAQNKFGWPAFAPIILNGVWILSIWTLAPQWTDPQEQIYVIAGSILVAGLVQLGSLIRPFRQLGYRFDRNWRDSKQEVNRVLNDMVPILIGLSITQINVISDSLIAWGFSASEQLSDATSNYLIDTWEIEYPLQAGTASALYFGQRLFQFPVGFFGMALGTVLFPLMTKFAKQQDTDKLQETLTLGLKLVVGIGFPASLGMFILAEPITRLLFEYGQFSSDDSVQTASMIAAYGAAVWSACAILILHRGFYALGDRMTPLRVGLQMVVLNLCLNLSLIWFFAGVGLAISTAICSTVQAWLVTRRFEKQIGKLNWSELNLAILKTSLATLCMGIACYLVLHFLPPSQTFFERVLNVIAPISTAIAVYFIAALILKMDYLWALFKRTAERQK